MQSRVKQRILGFIVLISLAIMFLPSILDGDNGRQPLKKSIPVRPAVKPTEIVMHQPVAPEVKQSRVADEAQAEPNDQDSSKLTNPQVSQAKTEKTDKNKVEASKQQAGSALDKVTSAPKTPSELIKASDSDGLPSWVVQVGTFSNKDNAIALVAKLKENELPAFKTTKIITGKTNYVVYVGQFKQKSEAQDKKQKIEAVAGLKVLVQPFKALLE